MNINDGDRTSSHGSTEMERSIEHVASTYGGAVLSSSTSDCKGNQASAEAKARSRRLNTTQIDKEYANIISKFDRNIGKLDSMR